MIFRFLRKIKFDLFVLYIILAVVLANFIPVTSHYETTFRYITQGAVSILFFIHGAKLSTQDISKGLTNWKTHVLILGLTFLVFPLLGMVLSVLPNCFLHPSIYNGFLFLCVLPSTIQSSIIFTSTARGNVATAMGAASISSLLGVFISPFLANILLETQGISTDIYTCVQDILVELMLPFVLGHLCRPFLDQFIKKYPQFIKQIDQSSIILIVYTSFSKAIINGLWTNVAVFDIFVIIMISCFILLAVIFLSKKLSKLLKFSTEDQIATLFCGSKKSMVNGIPMANVIFPAHLVGTMILPLMIFHQIQLIISAIIAQKYAQRSY